jgi:hypothetical protein
VGYIENHLNIDFGIKNERQDCKVGTVCVGEVLVEGGRANGDEGKGI